MSSQTAWVATVEASDVSPLAALRLIPGLEFALLPPILWLRGPDWNEGLALAMRKIPGLQRYTLLPENRLLAEGKRVPSGRLPPLAWRPLRDGLPVMLPTGPMSSLDATRASITLVRTSEEQVANALLVEWSAWSEFAVAAAEIRLRDLRFAAARDGRAWIEGRPVPSLAGERYHLRDGIAVPCGWTWSPALDVAVLRRWLGLAPGDTAMGIPGEGWVVVQDEQFVGATRKAVRLTGEELPRHG